VVEVAAAASVASAAAAVAAAGLAAAGSFNNALMMTLITLLFTFLLQAPTKNPEPRAELQAILSCVFTNYGMSDYLDHPPVSEVPLLFRFEKPPIYHGTALPKQFFTVPYRQKRLVTYDSRLGNDKQRAVIIIEDINVEKAAATVRLWIPYNGVIGHFSLHKSKIVWLIVNAVVEQT
jgi:hypothetical protein